jgi:hypothetical protein
MEMKMGYYRRHYMQAATPRHGNPELVERVEKAAARGMSVLTDWERNFLGSLLDSARKWGRLTGKQHDVFQRIEKKTDPKHQAVVQQWREGFTPEMREKLVFAARYYKVNPPYYGDVAERILNDSAYMPSQKLYQKMVENRYVQRAMENNLSRPQFATGAMVKVRDSCNVSGRLVRLRGAMAMVIAVGEEVMCATKGSRKVTILPVGASETIVTEERWLKPCRA